MNDRPLKLVIAGSPNREAALKKAAARPVLENHLGKDLDPNVPRTRDWKLAPPDQEQLARQIVEAPDQAACRATFEKITNQTLLIELAMEGATDFIRLAAIPRVNDEVVLADFALSAKLVYKNPDIDAFLEDLEKLTSARVGAVNRIANQGLLRKLAMEAESSDVRKAAMKRLTDQILIAQIAQEDQDFVVRFATIERLTDQDILAKIAARDKHDIVRSTAVKRLAHLKAGGT
jgi:hypothetical protein